MNKFRKAIIGAVAGWMAASAVAQISPNTQYYLQNVNSGLAGSVSGAATSNGAPIVQWPYNGSANSIWTFVATSNGYFQIVNANSSKDIVVQSAATTNGAKIIQYSFGSGRNDQWKPVQNTDGSYTFLNLKSGLALEVPGNSVAQGTQLDQWATNGGANQEFTVNAASSGSGNIAPSGTAYGWNAMTASSANTGKSAQPGLNDNNLTADVDLDPAGDAVGAWEAGGVIWSSPVSISSADFINGTITSGGDGFLTASLKLQFTTDGSTWTDSGWTVSPSYPYSSSAGGQTYTFSGTAVSGVLGARVIGQVRTTDTSYHWILKEVQFTGSTSGGSPDFSLSASPSSVSVTQGSSGNSTITETDINGFNGSVTMSASGLPSGVTASFAPNPTTSTTTLTLTASSTATTGTATVTVTGTSGSLTHTTTVSLTVNAAAQPDFSLSASPSSVSVTQGANGTSTVTVNPVNGYSGTVSLSASGLPSGVTASFNPASTTSSSTLTLTASSTATTGTASVTVSGTDGTLTHTTTISLTVNASSTGALPSGWTDADIGTVGMTGSASYNSGTFTVAGSGADIWTAADAFNYAYESVSGDQTVIARVVSENGTQSFAKAGVMIRESLANNSVEASTLLTPTNGVGMEVRSTTGAASVNVAGWVKGPVPPRWVKLVRSGSTFTASYSTDGSTWTQIASTNVTMATSATAGLAVTAHTTTALNTATFDNVSITGGSGCPPTAITPFLKVNTGSWQQTDTVTINSGDSVTFGPQPTNSSGWSWTGPNGFSSTTRQITVSSITSSGNYVATYVNTCGTGSSDTFVVTVSTSSSNYTAAQVLSGVQKKMTSGNQVNSEPHINTMTRAMNVNVYQVGSGVFAYTSSMAIDDDGIDPDPDPDHQSQTTWTDDSGHYLGAHHVAYYVLGDDCWDNEPKQGGDFNPCPHFYYANHNITGLQFALIFYNGNVIGAVFGDTQGTDVTSTSNNDSRELGEDSVHAATELGIPDSGTTGGVDSGVTVVIFSGSQWVVKGADSPTLNTNAQAMVQKALNTLGPQL